MFLLEDGRKLLYQWDLNRRLQVEDPTITEVHFCNRTDDCALVVATYTDDTYDGKTYADIPNIILQQPWDIRAYAYCTDGFTKIEEVFEVKARTKPADYVYTETEVKDYEDLKERIDEIEKNGIKADLTGYATEQWVEDKGYLTEHQSLEGLATEKYVQDAIANIDIPESGSTDLSNYYTKDETYSKTEVDALIPSHEGLATEEYVDNAIANVEIPETSTVYNLQLPTNGTVTDEATIEFLNKVFDTGVLPCASVYLGSILAPYTIPDDVSCTIVRVDRRNTSGYSQLNFWLIPHLALNQNDIEFKRLICSKSGASWQSKHITETRPYATKSYVDNAIQDALNAIGVAEGGAY